MTLKEAYLLGILILLLLVFVLLLLLAISLRTAAQELEFIQAYHTKTIVELERKLETKAEKKKSADVLQASGER